MKIKFKHNKKNSMKALNSDLSVSDVNKLVNKAMHKFMTDDSKGKLSHLAEILHNDLPYAAILYIAVQNIKERTIAEHAPKFKQFSEMLQELMEDLERPNQEPKTEGDAGIQS